MTESTHEPQPTNPPTSTGQEGIRDLPPVTPGAWQATLDRVTQGMADKAQQAAEVPFIPLEADAERLADFEELIDFAGRFQQEVGVEPTATPPSSIRFMSPDNMRLVKELTGHKATTHAFFEAFTGLIYVPELEKSHLPRLERAYTLAHELGHKLTPGLGDDQRDFALREGTVEKFARLFTRDFRSRYMAEEESRLQRAFEPDGLLTKYVPRDTYGHPLSQEETLYMHPTNTGLCMPFNYLAEVRMVNEIEQRLGAEGMQEYWRRSMTPEANALNFVRQQIGDSELRAVHHHAYGVET